jgi:hypothetical protein
VTERESDRERENSTARDAKYAGRGSEQYQKRHFLSGAAVVLSIDSFFLSLSLSLYLILSLFHSFSLSLTHSLNHSLTHSLSLPLSLSLSLILSLSHSLRKQAIWKVLLTIIK